MFSLYWWVYLVIGLSVFISTAAAIRYEEWRESKRKTGPDYPCLVHLGTEENGTELYCGLLDGHQDPHGTEQIFTSSDTTELVNGELAPIEWPVSRWSADQTHNDR